MAALNGPHGPTDPSEQDLVGDSEIASVPALSSVLATSSSQDEGARRQTVVVDSGSFIHVIADGAPQQAFESVQPSKLHIKSASGHTVPAKHAAAMKFGFGKSEKQCVLLHALEGNRTWLFSMDKLASMGFDFDLTNQPGRQSYMTWVETGERIVLRRQHPERNEGFWLVDLLFEGERGQGRVLNSVEDQGQDGAVHLVDQDGIVKVELPRRARVLSAGDGADNDPMQLQTALDAQEADLDFGTDFQTCLLVSSLRDSTAVHEHEWKGRATTDHHLDSDVAKHVFGNVIPSVRDYGEDRVMMTHTRTDTLGEYEDRDEARASAAASRGADKKVDTRRGRKRPRPRSHDINGIPLHQALCHPTARRFDKWERCADGFPNRITHAARCTCAGCYSGKLRRRTVAKERKALHALLRPGTSWSFDISRMHNSLPECTGNRMSNSRRS